MIIEQIIKFEFRGLVPLGCICAPATDYFYDKTKISKKNLRVDYYLLLKYCTRQCTLLSPIPGPNHLQNLTPKCKILKCFRLKVFFQI